MDVENYLNQNCKDYELLSNGVYHATYYNGNEIYIPKDYNGTMDVLAYYPGKGGSAESVDSLRDAMGNDAYSNTILAISKEAFDKGDLLGSVDEFTDTMNINVNNATVVTYSASGATGFKSLNDYATNNPSLDNMAMVVIDGCNIQDNIINKGVKYDALIDREVPIYMVGYSGAKYQDQSCRWNSAYLNGMGYNTIYFRENYEDDSINGHVAIKNDMFNDGVLSYLLGHNDDIDASILAKYEAGKYHLDANHNVDKDDVVSLELSDLIIDTIGGYNIKVPNVHSFTSSDDFVISEVDSDVSGKYKNLSVLSTFNIANLNLDSDKLGDTIISDLDFAVGLVNEIRGKIKGTNFLGGFKKANYRSSSLIPGCIGQYIDEYFDAVGESLNKLTMDTDAALSVGLALAGLENDLKDLAEIEIDTVADIDNQVVILGEDNIDKNIIETPTNETGETISNITSSEESNLDKNIIEVSSNETGETVSNITSSEESNLDRNVIGEPIDETKETVNNISSSEDVSIQETIYEGDGYKVLIGQDGDNIVSFKYQYECGSLEDAQEMYNQLFDKYGKLDFFDHMELNGNNVIINFKENAFEGLSLDQILEKYNIGKQINI